MKKIDVHTQATQFDSIEELSNDDRELIDAAVTARGTSYSPYSNFSVGAAVLLDNGEVVLGSNQENAAYPSGMCAERVAIWNAAIRFPNAIIKKLAIVAGSKLKLMDRPVGPCGPCRQSLLEYELKQEEPIEILFKGEEGPIIKVNSVGSLLPFNFDSTYL